LHAVLRLPFLSYLSQAFVNKVARCQSNNNVKEMTGAFAS
jgi:hypothetical protein